MSRLERWMAGCALVACSGLASGCGGTASSSPTTPTSPPVTTPPQTTGVTISIVGNSGTQAFSPNPAMVPTGQTVTFRNTTGSTHRIVADNGVWDAGTLGGGVSSAAIAVGAAVSFHCSIHGSMSGSIAVGQ